MSRSNLTKWLENGGNTKRFYRLGDVEIPSPLQPVTRGDKFIFDCPKCGARKSCWGFSGKIMVRCNRLNHCAYESTFSQLLEQFGLSGSEKAPAKPLEKKKVKKKEALDLDSVFKGSFGSIPEQTKKYLEKRIPGCDVNHLISHRIIADPRKIDHKDIRKLLENDYSLTAPLYGIADGKICSAQSRYSGDGEPSRLTASGKPIKICSISGRYHESGATFGSLMYVLSRLESNFQENHQVRTLVVAEGLVDYLTFRSAKINNVVGIPGAQQAPKIARYLASIHWEGNLLLSMDGDKAGDDAVKSVYESLGNYGGIRIFNVRKSSDGKDINDLYQACEKRAPGSGPESLENTLKNAVEYQGTTKLKDADKDPHQVDMKQRGLWTYGKTMPRKIKDRCRLLITEALKIKEKTRKAPGILKLRKTMTCCDFQEFLLIYRGKKKDPFTYFSTQRVAETTTCAHCVSRGFNDVVLREIFKDGGEFRWPDTVWVGVIPFEHGNLKQALELKNSASHQTRFNTDRDRREGDIRDTFSFFQIIDVVNSRVVFATGKDPYASNIRGPVANFFRSHFSDFALDRYPQNFRDKVNLDTFVRNYFSPAYMSVCNYTYKAVELLNEEEAFLDQILNQRFERYYGRNQFDLPKQSEIKKALQEIAKEKRLKKMEGYEPLPDDTEVFINFKEDSENILDVFAMSYQKISYDNLSWADVNNRPMKFNPGDCMAGNFLEHSWMAPKPVSEILADFYKLYRKQDYDPVRGDLKARVIERSATPANETKLKPADKEKLREEKKKNETRRKKLFAEAGYDPATNPYVDPRYDEIFLIDDVVEAKKRFDARDEEDRRTGRKLSEPDQKLLALANLPLFHGGDPDRALMLKLHGGNETEIKFNIPEWSALKKFPHLLKRE